MGHARKLLARQFETYGKKLVFTQQLINFWKLLPQGLRRQRTKKFKKGLNKLVDSQTDQKRLGHNNPSYNSSGFWEATKGTDCRKYPGWCIYPEWQLPSLRARHWARQSNALGHFLCFYHAPLAKKMMNDRWLLAGNKHIQEYGLLDKFK